MKKIFILAGIGIISLVACSKSDNPEQNNGGGGGNTLDCSTVSNKAYAANISPIIQSKCATNSNCHGTGGGGNGPGTLLTYTSIFNARVQIRAAVASGLMPKEGTITVAQKNSLLCWIDSGAPEN